MTEITWSVRDRAVIKAIRDIEAKFDAMLKAFADAEKQSRRADPARPARPAKVFLGVRRRFRWPLT